MTQVDIESAEALEAKYDPDLQFRPIGTIASWIVGTVLVGLTAFHYCVAGFLLLRDQLLYGIHLSFVLGLIFLVYGWLRKGAAGGVPKPSTWYAPLGIPLFDWLLSALIVVATMYLPLLPTDVVSMRVGNPSMTDVVMGSIMLILVLEATRRTMGIALPLVALVFVAYALFGQYAPGILVHPGASWNGLINHLYMTAQGFYGIAVGVVAKYVFLFVVFGVIATRIGLGQLFIDLASIVAGRYAGGPAKVAIFSSAMLGMINGSSIANTVTTGSLTIPAMKKVGYEPHFAGAVEATASTGGQITPPIMGAAAFIMAEFLEMPYREILYAAFIPAAMHYLGVFTMVHLEAKKLGLRGLTADEIPRLFKVIREKWLTLIPIVALIVMILMGRTPDYAAFWGISLCVIVGFLNPVDRLTIGGLLDALRTGAKYALSVGAAAATVGIIVGVVTLTGVGFRFSFLVIQIAQDIAAVVAPFIPFGLVTVADVTLFLTLVFTAVACIFMGAGIPTTATYIILVTVAAGALVNLQVPVLVAHFFVFYYGVLADITPPVALAAYAGAGIAHSDPFRTGNTAFRLAAAKALVPFVFVYSPVMLLVAVDFHWGDFIITMTGCIIGILMLGASMIGFILAPVNAAERVLLGISSLCLIAPSLTSTAVGLLVSAPVLVRQLFAWQRAKQVAAEA